MVFLLMVSHAPAQYVSSYNNSFTGPNLNRAKEEAYNRQMREEQEKWRQKRYAEEAKAYRYSSSGTNNYETKVKKPPTTKAKTVTVPEKPKSKYDYVSTYIDGLAEATLNGKSGFVDRNENEVVPVIYELVNLFWEGLAAVKLNGKYGFVDTKGKVVIPLKYDYAWRFIDGKANVLLDKKETYINKNGVALFPFKYDNVYAFSNGTIQAWLNKKTGLLDITGKEIIPVKYDSVIHLVDAGKMMFLKGSHYYFDEKGKPMMNVYDFIDEPDEYGGAFVSLNDKWGKIDSKGKLIIPLKYEHRPFKRYSMTEIFIKGKYGFLNDDDKEVIKPQFDTIYRGFDLAGEAIVGNGKQMFSIDKTGKKIQMLKSIPEEATEKEAKPSPFARQYDQVGEAKEGFTPVSKKDKWGYINSKGVLVIPLKYDYALEFENGIASVQLNEKWGYVNTKGKEVVPVKYESADFFSNGLASIKINGKWGYINPAGIMVIKPQFDNAGRFNKKGKATVIIKDDYYWIDRTGKIIEKQ